MDLRTLSGKLEDYLTPGRAVFIIVLLGLIQLAVGSITLLPQFDGDRAGGDFVAFWTAGREVFGGRLVGLYAPDALAQAIALHRPEMAEITSGLTWQYPPHGSLIFSPIGILPYMPAYLIWCGLGLAAFAFAIRPLGFGKKGLAAILLSPLVLSAIVTGQNGLFTAALLILAITQIGPRPVLAGLAAAGLTVKPQLGLLLPVAYLAARAWVPFFTAAAGSLILWAGSVLIAGRASWLAFFESVQGVGTSIETGLTPLFKMVTVYSALTLAGAPGQVTILVSLIVAALAIFVVGYVWRQSQDTALRLATVSILALLIAPYGYYYELTIALPALLIVVQYGHRSGWLAFELPALVAIFIASIMLPGPEIRSGVSYAFVLMVCMVGVVLRRVFAELAQEKSSSLPASTIKYARAAL